MCLGVGDARGFQRVAKLSQAGLADQQVFSLGNGAHDAMLVVEPQ